ncbi:P-loop containing nucleoside triphosphate hydrolase protein [Chaetomium fimeti]|uniref:P-loop containing nucleoside triphosphate hydrolase protein n=1 Tax=Chaetomium fimeti TaxID=1854472 RepID=A0AAE0H5Y9_9PEZI|nr:P-loop containing nucleoside triphosphate hydrolase protein [Chaetomium fimeti]
MHYDRYSHLLVSISGVVFLGTPHLLEGVGNRAFGERLVGIMKLEDAAGSLSNKCLTRLKESSHMLADLAGRFNRTNLRVDILSVFEQKVTRIRQSGALRRSKTKKMIPPAALASTHSGPYTSTYVNAGSSSRQEMQSLLDNFSTKQADPRIPCFMMETLVRNKNFFGRQDILTHLDECLLPSGDLLVSSQPERIRVGLLCGMGGLGKTETAIEYAYSRRDRFDAIFLIRAEDTSKLEADLAQIAVRLGIQDPNEPDDKVINRGLALEWLCNPFKIDYEAGDAVRVPTSWLVIFDNADEPDILAPYRDITASGAVLITSRSPLAKTSFSPQTTEIDIRSFGTEEAGDFVQSITGIDGHLDEARRIGARLGGLPLALAQMAGIIRLEFLSYTEFLELYNDAEEAADVHGTVLQPLRASARGSLSTVWTIEKLSASARAVLEISSFLDPDCIQESMLTHEVAAIDHLIPEFPTKRGAFFAARKQLIGSSLIRHNKELAEYWVHRVTQDVVRAKMEPARRKHVFANAVAIVSAAWPATAVGGHDVTLWELSEKLYQHVTSLSDMYLCYLEPGDDGSDMAFATLLNRAGWYQHERGESRVQLPVLELALELCQGITTIDTRDLESDIRYALGAVANETNDAASCRLHTERFFEIRLDAAAETGAVDERLARSYNQMGIVWMMAGEYKKAEESFATSAREYEKIPGYTKDKRSLALVNLGLAYWLQGSWDRASEILELGLADREELYGYMDSHSFRCARGSGPI